MSTTTTSTKSSIRISSAERSSSASKSDRCRYPMNPHTEYFTLAGAAGALQCALDLPDAEQFPTPRGLALVAHPHPLFGGTMDNKVTQTLARSMLALGYVAVRLNFRGVGQSAGVYDEGVGETDD